MPLALSNIMFIFWLLINVFQIINLFVFINITYPINLISFFGAFKGTVNLDIIKLNTHQYSPISLSFSSSHSFNFSFLPTIGKDETG